MLLLSPATMTVLQFTEIEKFQQQFVTRNPDYAGWFEECLQDINFSEQLARTWLGSQFSAELCIRQPAMFKQLVESQQLQIPYDDQSITTKLTEQLVAVDTTEQLDRVLRQHRNREQFRVIWRDLNRLAKLEETTRDISLLAEASIQQALNFHHRQLCQQFGIPSAVIDDQICEQKMLVLGMGKLGAWELNLSSDIDLIFSFPYSGETQGAKKSLSNDEFFTRLARKLIQSLDQTNTDGFVFRVDMRLRPYGDSGALVLSFSAMEEYYQNQGRDWERYAMVKARVVAGDEKQSQQLIALLRSFTYRRYVDFSAIESLRAMKKMIHKEMKRRRLHNDIKLGPGGIREVEFIAQCFQLIRGGRDKELQQRRVQIVLAILADKNYMPAGVIDELQQAYIFLRNTEHAIQAYKDQQTQMLPEQALPQSILAWVMGFVQWQDFTAALQQHRDRVDYHFCQLIAEDKDCEETDKQSEQWQSLWLGELSALEAEKKLTAAGHEAAYEVVTRLQQLRQQPVVLRMQAQGRERLDQFMPLLLQALISHSSTNKQPSATLLRILPLIESVLRRTAYLLLLSENAGALNQLIILSAASPWIATQLAKHPVLLDELLDTQSLYQVPGRQILRDELQQQMLRLPEDDLEAQMECLRYFKMAHQLQVSAAEVTGQLPLVAVSDYLTVIAETILERVLELAWYGLTARYGYPQKNVDVPCNKDFIIVGYGKVGGVELGHSSDLDLVFIHDAGTNLATDGEHSVDNAVFFARLGQRIIHILTAQTPSGMLYEVDMRLRPSGNSGLLVSSLQAFENYQRAKAWTWEHQALVRARVVAGDSRLTTEFEKLRIDLLCQSRNASDVKQAVVTMRQKMRDHLLPKELEQADPPIFHLKHGTGAIVDIEFMVQYAVLAWSHQYPALATYTDNIRILETLNTAGLFSAAEVEALVEAYKVYRSQVHRLNLLQQPSEVPVAEFEQYRAAVVSKWSELMQ